MGERISVVNPTIEEINTTVKNAKSNKIMTQKINEIWDIMKRPNVRIIGIEGEDA